MKAISALLLLASCAARLNAPVPSTDVGPSRQAPKPAVDWSKRVGAGCETGVAFDWLADGQLALICGAQLELLDSQHLQSAGFWTVPTREPIQSVVAGPDSVLFVLSRSGELWSLGKKELESTAVAVPDTRFGKVRTILGSRGGSVAIVEASGRLSVISPGDASPYSVTETHSEVAWVDSSTLSYCSEGSGSAGGLFLWSVGRKEQRRLATPEGCGPILPHADGAGLTMQSHSWQLPTGVRTPTAIAPISRGFDDCLTISNALQAVELPDGGLIRPTPSGFGVERLASSGATSKWVAETLEPVTQLKLSPDGERLIGRCGPESLCAWNAVNGVPLQLRARTVSRSAPVLVVGGSDDGSLLVSGSRDGAAIAWDLKGGAMSRLDGALRPTARARGSSSVEGWSSAWRCIREASFLGNLAVAPSGDTAAFTSRSTTHVFHRAYGSWSQLPEKRDGVYVGTRFVFPHGTSWLALDRPHSSLRQAVRITGRTTGTTISSADRAVAAGDQRRFAIDTGTALELRSAGEPFGELLHSLPLGEPQAISPHGDCVLGTLGHWCEGAEVRAWRGAQQSPAFFLSDLTEVVFSRSSDPLEPLTPWTPSLFQLSLPSSLASAKSHPPVDLSSNDRERAALQQWQVGAASTHTQRSLMFVWTRKWFVQASRSGSLLFERAPGAGVLFELVPLTDFAAAYVLATDGRYDVIGPDAGPAARELACVTSNGPPSLAACGASPEPGLLAHLAADFAESKEP